MRSTDASKYLAVINFTVTLIPEGEVGISNPLSALNTQQSATYNLAGQRIAALPFRRTSLVFILLICFIMSGILFKLQFKL